MNNQENLLEAARTEIRRKNLSRKTENAYLKHIGRYLEFCADADISVKRAAKINGFLTFLKPTTADATRNQAHSALLFFYRDVLCQKLSARFKKIERVRCPAKKPETFTDAEVRKILKNMHGASFLVAALMYGAGLRLPEALKLRVDDLDFAENEIKIRHPQTGKIERRTILPATLVIHLRQQIKRAEYLYEEHLTADFGIDILLSNKGFYPPNAANLPNRQYLFPASKLTEFNGKKNVVRQHLAESTIQKAFAEALAKARIEKDFGCQTLRYSFATRLYEQNCAVRTISRLLGHKNLKSTLNYFNNPQNIAFNSPLD